MESYVNMASDIRRVTIKSSKAIIFFYFKEAQGERLKFVAAAIVKK